MSGVLADDVAAVAPRRGRSGLRTSRTGDHRRARVLFCIDNMGIGGTELNAVRWAERLDRSRFDLSVLCLQEGGPLLARYEALGVRVITLPLRRLYGLTALRQGRWLTRYLRLQHVDLVHSHDVYDNIFTTTWARLARTPVVVASRRWWDEVPRPALRAANRAACRLADCVVANSQAIAELLICQERVPAARVAVIPNSIGDEPFAPPDTAARHAFFTELGIPGNAFVLGCIAGLRPVKGHESLLLAVASLRQRWPELHLVLVGDGPSRGPLQDLARRLQIDDAVHFAGVRPNHPNLHHLFDVSVLASLSEASPNSLIEAMAAARPVVATHVGGVPDIVADGEMGLLVPTHSPESLAATIEQLRMDPGRRRRMGDAGQRRARDRFGAPAVMKQLEALYMRLLAAHVR